MSASIVDEVASKVTMLPLEKQREVLDFVEFILHKTEGMPAPPRKSLRGSLAHLGFDAKNEDIDEVRREMWKNFPREDI